MLNNLQIGKAGELLVQYKLLKAGIESAPLTTDAGIDLVAFSPHNDRPVSIQVKTNNEPKRAGGKGKLALDWNFPEQPSANLFAAVDLSENRVWLLTPEELRKETEKHTGPGNKNHLYMYVDPNVSFTAPKESAFASYLLEKRLDELFLGWSKSNRSSRQ